MDPLNGAADIEMRALRLVSNYGFIEDPSLLIRATRLRARLGWEMDPELKLATTMQRAKASLSFFPPTLVKRSWSRSAMKMMA